MIQLRFAMDDMIEVGRPLMKDFNDAIAALSLEDVVDIYSATRKLRDDLGGTWKEIKNPDRGSVVVEFVDHRCQAESRASSFRALVENLQVTGWGNVLLQPDQRGLILTVAKVWNIG